MRMEACNGQIWLVRCLVHDSRTPLGGKPKAKNDVDRWQLRCRNLSECLVKQALHHHRGRAFKKVLLAADIKPHRIDVNNSRPVA